MGNPRLEQAVEVLSRQSEHMVRLIDGLLEVSRIARGKVPIDRDVVDLRTVCEEVLQDRRTRVDESAVMRVCDTGVGIAPDKLSTIFETFHQESQHHERSSGGLGLGLALAKSLAELHDGSIEAHSDGLGQGAEFTVRLPLHAEPPRRDEASDTTKPGVRSLLLVEDNRDVAAMLHDLLAVQGHDVKVVHNGEDALEALEAGSYDVCLCDIGLPDMSGHEIARAARSSDAIDDVTLVALTGYGQADDRARSKEAGFDAHLTKPVRLADLTEVLGSAG